MKLGWNRAKVLAMGVLLVLTACGTAVSAQTAIGIKFVGGHAGATGASMTANDKAGVPTVAQKNWNALSGTSGTDIALKANDGSATKTTVTYSCPSTYSAGLDSSKGADYALMDGFLDTAGDGTTPKVTVKGIAYPVYDVYVYFNGDAPQEHRQGTYTIGNESIAATDGEAFAGEYKRSDKSSTGNYVVFTGLKGATFTLTCATGPTDGASRCIINGLQVVESK